MTATEDVVVVGAGPSGLFAACELERHGIRTRIVDAGRLPHPQSRATAVQPATLELFARAGVVDAFLESSVHIARGRIYGPGLSELRSAGYESIDCPFPFQCSLPQRRTEELVTAHLRSLGGVVEEETAVTAVELDGDAVRLELRRADGRQETVRARYVIGAGGGHSVVRASMGERLEGETYPRPLVSFDVAFRSSLPADELSFVVGPAGYLLVVPLPGGRAVVVADLDAAAAQRLPSPTLADARAILGARLPAEAEAGDLRWASVYWTYRRMAPRLSGAGRFLVGDAAHMVSPFGGEGMNVGVQDAADIAWKLALVLCGRGRPLLLESYEAERSAADRHAIDVSDRTQAMTTGLVDSYVAGRPPPPEPPADPELERAAGAARAMLDVSYAGSELVGQHLGGAATPPPGPAPGERYPCRALLRGTGHHLLVFPGRRSGARLADVAGHLRDRWEGLVEIVDAAADERLDAARAGVPDGGAILVRPDGMVGFRSVPVDGAGLSALDEHLSRYLIPAIA